MSNIRLFGRPSPLVPPVGSIRVFVDEADNHLKQIDSNGLIIDITKPSALVLPDNAIVINSVDQLPAKVGGSYQLEDNAQYIQGADLTIDGNILAGVNSSWTSNSLFGATLTYTGTDDMFFGADKNFSCSQVQLDCPNAANVFDFSSPTDPVGNIVRIEDVGILRCNRIGTFNNLQVLEFFRSAALAATNGVILLGVDNWSVLSYETVLHVSSSAGFVGIDFDASLQRSVRIINPIFRAPAGAIGIKGEADSSNISAGNLAQIVDAEFTGGITETSGITFSSLRYQFTNSGIFDTIIDGLMSFNNNALVTTIAAVNTPVLVNAVWSLQDFSKINLTTAGVATLLAERSVRLPVDVSMKFISVGGAAKTITVYLALDGVPIMATARSIQVSGSVAAPVTIPWQLPLDTGQTISVYVENNTDDVDLIAQSGIMRIN